MCNNLLLVLDKGISCEFLFYFPLVFLFVLSKNTVSISFFFSKVKFLFLLQVTKMSLSYQLITAIAYCSVLTSGLGKLVTISQNIREQMDSPYTVVCSDNEN